MVYIDTRSYFYGISSKGTGSTVNRYGYTGHSDNQRTPACVLIALLTRFARSSTLSKRQKQQPPGMCIHRIVIIKRTLTCCISTSLVCIDIRPTSYVTAARKSRSTASRYGYTSHWDNERVPTCIHIKQFIWSALVPCWFHMVLPLERTGSTMQVWVYFTPGWWTDTFMGVA